MGDFSLAAEQTHALEAKRHTPSRAALARFMRQVPAMASLVLLIAIAGVCFAAPWFETYLGRTAEAQDLFARFEPPSAEYWLGTDSLGRDVFLRLLYGGQVSLIVGVATAGIAAVIGTFIGLIAGFYRGFIDSLLMRLTDIVIALPLLPLLIVLAAVDLTKLGFSTDAAFSENAALYRIVAIIALVGWTTVARLVRASTLTVRTRPYVTAATALGVGDAAILRRHILPNVMSPVIIATTLSIGNVILLESVLSFLGLGIQPPVPSWGNMLTNAQSLIWNAPWLAIYPGLAIFVTVIAFNLLGDGLQQALNPKSNEQR
ncbi:MAG: ABC transporter permease [Pseudomonadota bacterium]